MVDKSEYPCKHCGHSQNEHGKHFPHCFACEDNRKSGGHKFERIENLEFLEWMYEKKEKLR